MTEQASTGPLGEHEGGEVRRFASDGEYIAHQRRMLGLTGRAEEIVNGILYLLLTRHDERYFHVRAVVADNTLEFRMSCDHDQLWRDVAAAAHKHPLSSDLFAHVQFPSG